MNWEATVNFVVSLDTDKQTHNTQIVLARTRTDRLTIYTDIKEVYLSRLPAVVWVVQTGLSPIGQAKNLVVAQSVRQDI